MILALMSRVSWLFIVTHGGPDIGVRALMIQPEKPEFGRLSCELGVDGVLLHHHDGAGRRGGMR